MRDGDNPMGVTSQLHPCIFAAASRTRRAYRSIIVVDLRGGAPDLQFQRRPVTDDVSAPCRVEGAHIDARFALTVAGDGVEVQNRRGRRQQRVAPLLRHHGRMGGLTGKGHIQFGVASVRLR